MEAKQADHRSTMITLDTGTITDSFAEDVKSGLESSPKTIPCRYFYDYAGSVLFEEICRLPEYYLTRAETEILEANAEEIVSHFPPNLSLVELGSGSCEKTRLIIEALSSRDGSFLYSPIDISKKMLEESAGTLLEVFPDLEIISVAAEYSHGLQKLTEHHKGPMCVLWLGSSIGNLEYADSVAFLKDVVRFMSPKDLLLIGFDLVKDVRIQEKAYNDSLGVTARFNLNLLERINRELRGEFDLEAFEHLAVYNEEMNRIELYIVSLKAQEVQIGALDQTFQFLPNERIHTENSHKYSMDTIQRLAGEVGLEISDRWFDGHKYFCTTLFKLV